MWYLELHLLFHLRLFSCPGAFGPAGSRGLTDSTVSTGSTWIWIFVSSVASPWRVKWLVLQPETCPHWGSLQPAFHQLVNRRTGRLQMVTTSKFRRNLHGTAPKNPALPPGSLGASPSSSLMGTMASHLGPNKLQTSKTWLENHPFQFLIFTI